MIVEIKLWMLVGVLGFMIPLFIWLAKLGINRIVSKLDELIKQNYDFNTKLVETTGKVNNLIDRVVMNEKRLDNHASRIRHLELNDKYFKEK